MFRFIVAAIILFQVGFVEAARLKDVVNIEGVRDNPLTGFGLVVGLNGTGDSGAAFTNQSLKMMLERMGISAKTAFSVKNVASVMVTATLPPFARQGSRIDVTLSSLGDAKTLQGGTLVMTPLKGADGKIYAVAQGALSIGGFAAGGGGTAVQKNHPTVGRISGGAIIEREIKFKLNRETSLQLALKTLILPQQAGLLAQLTICSAKVWRLQKILALLKCRFPKIIKNRLYLLSPV